MRRAAQQKRATGVRRAAGRRRRGVRENREKRRYPIGAELLGGNRVSFRVWAPKAQRIEVVLQPGKNGKSATHVEGGDDFAPAERGGYKAVALRLESDGYFSGEIEAAAGMDYGFRVDESQKLYPDPASRFQPNGPHGPSRIVDPFAYRWKDPGWPGLRMHGQVFYEMHIGTFTREGTWTAARRELAELARIGVTTIEMMPIADFAGAFGWGYDGVDLFAPTRLYGEPDDLRAFVDRAHSLGLGVILDLVYNHFGPSGNYLSAFSDHYMAKKHDTDWGDAINFDDPDSAPVREFFITNACYWIEEFHFDGFRFDATQNIIDNSEEYIVGAIGRAAREAAGKRSIILVAENEPQTTKLVRPRSEGGDDLDGLWNDDWHHSALVTLNDRNEAYYTDYNGSPQEFISAAKYGYLYQGQPFTWQEAPRGTPAFGLDPETFVAFIENHDQVANTLTGDRVRSQTSPGKYRAMTALLLLGPWTPLLFQGQEFGATAPFVYFCDVDEELRAAIRKGRFEFLAQFPSMAGKEAQRRLPEPSDPRIFAECKLDFKERQLNKEHYDLHKDLLKLRRRDARFSEQKRGAYDGAVLNGDSLVLRFFGPEAGDRLLIVNFGKRRQLEPAAEPLLAPPDGFQWETLWTSERVKYGGPGAVRVASDKGWLLPGEAAVALRPVRRTQPRPKPIKRIL